MDKYLDEYNNKKFIYIPLNGKVPYIKNWNQKTKSIDIPEGKNAGVLTGKVSKITVVDIDYKEDGMKTWNSLMKLYPSFITPIVITPNSGLHLYFKYNKNLPNMSRLKINNRTIGWDIMNDGRQAVVPPSTDLLNHKKYKWKYDLSNEIIEMPKWFRIIYSLLIKINYTSYHYYNILFMKIVKNE
jgi:hypothetical protein